MKMLYLLSSFIHSSHIEYFLYMGSVPQIFCIQKLSPVPKKNPPILFSYK